MEIDKRNRKLVPAETSATGLWGTLPLVLAGDYVQPRAEAGPKVPHMWPRGRARVNESQPASLEDLQALVRELRNLLLLALAISTSRETERWCRAEAYTGIIQSDTLRHAARSGHIRRRKLPGGHNEYHDGDVRRRWSHLFDVN